MLNVSNIFCQYLCGGMVRDSEWEGWSAVNHQVTRISANSQTLMDGTADLNPT